MAKFSSVIGGEVVEETMKMTMNEPVRLWPEGLGEGSEIPTLTVFPAAALAGKPPMAPGESSAAPDAGTVLICPGGGYGNLAKHEGESIAWWLNGQGFDAVVLRYRLGPRYHHPAMVHDAQRAMRLVRARGREWGVRPEFVAVMGFSAGGHLASTLAVHYDYFHCGDDDLAGEVSARPDAAVLCYPVIDMVGSFTHHGSRGNLLGPQPAADLLNLMSTDRHVTPDTPPTFLWHTADDSAVPVENSLRFCEACRRQNVPVELHVYESGPHGLGLAEKHPMIATWTERCTAFLRRRASEIKKAGKQESRK